MPAYADNGPISTFHTPYCGMAHQLDNDNSLNVVTSPTSTNIPLPGDDLASIQM